MMNEKIDSLIRLRNRNVPRYLPIPKNYLRKFSNEIRRHGDEHDEEKYESYKKGKKHCKQRLHTDLDCKPLKHLHKEQHLTKQLFDEIKAGKFFERCKKERLKDERIKAHLKTYVKSSQLDFLDGLIEIFDDKQKEIISNDSETENN
ncbi:hypothetical protein BpHYR1_004431 [Brachionus plicatilis]|uniref:Uncharacterized protein n=1 Tax=Brachionus plicatilis TaxID=10195 RepID=A0A3M7QML3_BRAPC|nr:hypothetical protein BpHYR1_004431 [Brachionus plicatilis]